tara:strand:+ start:421 stop:588 length:168 start_codon:yes stop_codon:yes gene_type:complete
MVVLVVHRQFFPLQLLQAEVLVKYLVVLLTLVVAVVVVIDKHLTLLDPPVEVLVV